jgi:hypothetical protein
MVEIVNGSNASNFNASAVKPTGTTPVSTDIKTLYTEFEKTASTSRNRGQKATEIKDLIKATSAIIGKNKLALAALYRVIKSQNPDRKLDRSYFYNTALKQFENEKDDKDVVWIDVSKETQKLIPTT